MVVGITTYLEGVGYQYCVPELNTSEENIVSLLLEAHETDGCSIQSEDWNELVLEMVRLRPRPSESKKLGKIQLKDLIDSFVFGVLPEQIEISPDDCLELESLENKLAEVLARLYK